MRSEIDLTCRVFGPWREGAIQQVETGLNLTVVLTSDGQCFQMGETGASGRVKWEGCKEPELVCLLTRSACHLLIAICSGQRFVCLAHASMALALSAHTPWLQVVCALVLVHVGSYN